VTSCRALLVVLVSCASTIGAATAGSQRTTAPSLDEVLRRAGDYVVEYGSALSNVLAEEEFTQTLVWRHTREALQTRRLRSEIAFVRLVDSTEWLAFRNVLSVDGRPLPESERRLARLFDNPPATLLEQAKRIASESARYNIGPITREINVPTTALHFVHPRHRPQCRFEREGDTTEAGGERAWVVRFKERDRGGLISRGDGRNLPAQGRLWIVPADGRVLRSELIVEDFVRGAGDSKAQIDVTWRHDQQLDLWVPADMREHYAGPWRAMPAPKRLERYDIEGTATYSNYRRFRGEFRIR
jgi:hypothetical protein